MLRHRHEHFWDRSLSALESCVGVLVGLPDASIWMSKSLFDPLSYVGSFEGPS